MKLPDGTVVPWIDENLNPDTGDWIAREILPEARSEGPRQGLQPLDVLRPGDLRTGGSASQAGTTTLEVNPLVPEGAWDYFCLDDVRYHGRTITILYDRTGKHYGKGSGLRVFCRRKEVVASEKLESLSVNLPLVLASRATGKPPAAGSNLAGNPVLGGNLGTCFDVAVLKEGDKYRMWFSWRPKKSIALVESTDGIHWSEPRDRPRAEQGDRLGGRHQPPRRHPSRRTAITCGTPGQARGQSWIGYATSPDGKTWKRMSPKPVLSPEKPWEKTSRHVPARDLGRGDEALPDVVLRRRAVRAERHRLRHEPRRARAGPSTPGNPIFRPDPKSAWEQDKVTACQVVRQGDWHVMFYIGFRDVDHAQIGVARSKDGITGWQRHPANPIIRPGTDRWDARRLSTSPTRFSTATAGSSGTTAATAAWSRSGWRRTRGRIWGSNTTALSSPRRHGEHGGENGKGGRVVTFSLLRPTLAYR